MGALQTTSNDLNPNFPTDEDPNTGRANVRAESYLSISNNKVIIMENQCGQCGKPFSKACHTTFQCDYHKGDCFSCKPCKKEDPSPSCKLLQCSACPRILPQEELFLDYKCGKYICKYHFVKQIFLDLQFKLPCEHSTETEQIICFMSSFCSYCGRKIQTTSTWCQGICSPCENSLSWKQESPVLRQCAEGQLLQAGQFYSQKQPIQSDKRAKSNSCSQPDKDMEIVRILQKELEEAHLRLDVADYSRKKIKRILTNDERDKNCQICWQSFDLLARKPMMICLKQHLICEPCFHSKDQLVNCPLCRVPIPRQQVTYSREKLVTLETEQLLVQKYDYHLSQFLEHKAKIVEVEKLERKAKPLQTASTQVPTAFKPQTILVSRQTQTQQSPSTQPKNLKSFTIPNQSKSQEIRVNQLNKTQKSRKRYPS